MTRTTVTRLPGRSQFDNDSPNTEIDDLLSALMKKAKEPNQSPDVAVKIVAQAIAWEKVKYKIVEKDDDEYNPDA